MAKAPAAARLRLERKDDRRRGRALEPNPRGQRRALTMARVTADNETNARDGSVT